MNSTFEPNAQPMPLVFFGHGNPMNALQDNVYSRAWSEIGSRIARPKAIVAISAHWYLPGTFVTAMAQPRTIHDFGGFPPALYDVRYPAPGDPRLALRIRSLLEPANAALDERWGLDHGTWSVLVHAFPDADIPVVQISMNETLTPLAHYELAKRLGPLRDEGVLIIGSGNIVHNLHAFAWGAHSTRAFDWAMHFEREVRALIEMGDDAPLIDYERFGRAANLAVPTPEHYLPLLYVLALRRPDESIAFPVEGIDGGSISMLSLKIG